MYIALYTSDGQGIPMTKRSTTAGTWFSNHPFWCGLTWNSTSKISKGVIEYKGLSKGTYYIRVNNENNPESPINDCTIKATFPDGSASASNEIKDVTFEQTLKKGQSIQLGASLTPADGTGAISWKSSKTSVATVSATGKITAVGKGTAVITCTAGKGSAKIIIKVS